MAGEKDFDAERTLPSCSAGTGRSRSLVAGNIVGGNYQIVSFIGRGGMGMVYHARHMTIERDVALKALAPERVDPSNWDRFQTEGKAIARLDHANIVKVYDMGADGPDRLYYVMDLLQGVSLAEYVRKKGVLDQADTIEIFEQLCAGLGYAHKQGLVHRDVKPTNIILCQNSEQKGPLVKIIDFGLVKLLGEADQFRQSQTATGQVCGSPLYMSPEQCMGGKIDARSDIYSLGCTLFECLTGVPPFCGKSGLETASMHQNDRPPQLKDEHPDSQFSENFESLVSRMLEKIPAQRYQTMEQVAQDLGRIKEGRALDRAPVFSDRPLFERDEEAEIEHEEASRQTGAPLIWLALISVVAVILVGGFATYYFFVSREHERVAHTLVGDSQLPALVTGQKETPEIKNAREVFASCPHISAAVVQENGQRMRVINFPSVSIGKLSWGSDSAYQMPARGRISVPVNVPLILELSRPDSDYTHMFPAILAKVDADMFTVLRIIEPDLPPDDSTMHFEVSPQLIGAVSKWTALHYLVIHSCHLTDKAILTLNDLHHITGMDLRDSIVNGKTLARVKWLNQITRLDLRGVDNVDDALTALANNPNLVNLNLDRTAPSDQALQILTTCKSLQTLSLSEAEIDDQKLPVVCRLSNLRTLNLKKCMISPAALGSLAQLAKLSNLSLDGMGLPAEDVDKLRKIMPSCQISDKVVDKFKL